MNRLKPAVVLTAGCLWAMGSAAFALSQVQGLSAKAMLINADGKEVGSASLYEAPGGVRVRLRVSGLPPGPHAFHIHEAGRCDPPDFKSAGGHFNPAGKKHGLKNPQGHHAGDLPDLVVGADGVGSAEVTVDGVTLLEGENSLFHPGGTALVIHASPDDNLSDPAGNAGTRIACGVITR